MTTDGIYGKDNILDNYPGLDVESETSAAILWRGDADGRTFLGRWGEIRQAARARMKFDKWGRHVGAPELEREQRKTLATPRMKYTLLASALFVAMDLFYGRERTQSKFKVLEVIARVPYQSWEHVAYIAMTHKYGDPHFARRIFDFVSEARHQQDNEQWHLLILEEMTHRQGLKEGFVRFRLLPQLFAFFYYHVSWLLYVIRPGLSYQLNAHFEDHAEHEYMEFVRENPELEETPFESDFEKEYGSFTSQADLFRRIALDEREHKEESLARMNQPRFH